ncbi:hypothetical protein [Micromonospora sp. URMC 103]|uniref:hypothetical protein n=1 Tax=Micromonospora sp. URMC 103 TaxID=3423406 RepID=UPI003F1D88B9
MAGQRGDVRVEVGVVGQRAALDEGLGEDGALGALAFAELRSSGQAGAATVDLLVRLGRQFVRSHSFPPPDAYSTWSDEAVEDLLADMFSRPGAGHKFVLTCYLKATDGPSLERLLLAAIRSFLIDQAKSTERGKLRRRLETLLDGDERFARSQTRLRWFAAGGVDLPWQGDRDALARAAMAVRGVSLARLPESGPTPREAKVAILAVVQAALAEAAGAVSTEDLAWVVEQRFELLRPPVFTSLEADNTWLEGVESSYGADDVEIDQNDQVERLWATLSAADRVLLPHLAERNRWANLLGVGVARATTVGEALAARLRAATADDAECDELLLRLAERCRAALPDG